MMMMMMTKTFKGCDDGNGLVAIVIGCHCILVFHRVLVNYLFGIIYDNQAGVRGGKGGASAEEHSPHQHQAVHSHHCSHLRGEFGSGNNGRRIFGFTIKCYYYFN